jgi:UDP-glucose 4-epimerase
VIPLFITAMLQGRQPVIYGDGRQTRDFSFVANMVHGNLLAAEAAGVAGRIMNLANGRSTDLLTLLAALNRLLGLNIPPQHEPPRLGDIRDSLADITQARRLLGYEVQVEFDEGLRRSINYYRAQAKTRT